MSPERTHVIAPSPTPSRSGAPIHPTTVYLYEVELTLTGRVSVAMDPEQVTEKRSQLITHPTIDRLTTHWTTLAPITRMLTPSDSIQIDSISSIEDFYILSSRQTVLINQRIFSNMERPFVISLTMWRIVACTCSLMDSHPLMPMIILLHANRIYSNCL